MRDFHLPGRSAVFAENGMCATSHPLAAAEAVRLLQAGGNAMDAAIAGAILLGVCEPQMTGIGGDCFALAARPGEEVVAVNGSGRAPASADAAALRAAGHETVPPQGPEAVTIPGAIDGFCTLSERWGRLGIADSLAPAIRYFEQGVPVAPRVAFDWERDATVLSGAARRHYLTGGRTPRAGEVFRLPAQAELLRDIAAKGRAAFYDGPAAEDMLAALASVGGRHTPEDFAAAGTDTAAPIAGNYAGHRLLEHPPNGQGATAILILNILARFDLRALDPFGVARAHLEAEAAKAAYALRDKLIGDTRGTSGLDEMLSPATAERLAAAIDPKRAAPGPAAPVEAVHRDTVYISVVDRDRMAVSLIYSIFHGFGSGLASERYGVLFHNRGAGFTLAQGHPNEMAPGKRPMHTIIPALLTDEAGTPTMPFGVMGGQYQAAGHARVLTNIADYGLDPQEALDAPRSFPEAGVLKVERGYPDAVRSALAEMGHEVAVPDAPIGGAQAIRIHSSGVLEGASDPRKDGCALGY